MSNRITLKGINKLITDETLEPQRDYLIELVAERESKEEMDTFSDSQTEQTNYKLKVSMIKSITDIGENKKLNISQGRTPSQKLRYVVEQKLGEYEPFMNWLIANSDRLTDEYIEELNK